MNKSVLLACAAVVASLSAVSAQAQQLPVVGGFTSIQLTDSILSYEPTITGIGSVQLSPGSDNKAIAYFPITTGSLDTVSYLGDIQHIGSGLSISKGGSSVQLTDFIINTSNNKVFGNVTAGATDFGTVALFDIGTSGNAFAPFSLAYTQVASDVLFPLLSGVNSGSIAGVTFGFANTLPITAAVPEPSTYALLIGGLAVVGALANRRRRAANEAV